MEATGSSDGHILVSSSTAWRFRIPSSTPCMELCILPSRAESLGGVRTAPRATARTWCCCKIVGTSCAGRTAPWVPSELPCVSGRPSRQSGSACSRAVVCRVLTRNGSDVACVMIMLARGPREPGGRGSSSHRRARRSLRIEKHRAFLFSVNAGCWKSYSYTAYTARAQLERSPGVLARSVGSRDRRVASNGTNRGGARVFTAAPRARAVCDGVSIDPLMGLSSTIVYARAINDCRDLRMVVQLSEVHRGHEFSAMA